MERNYEFTGETLDWYGVTLNRIRATKDFGNIKKGDLGGWIQKYENLCSNAWVFENAKVLENARVSGNARVSENAIVSGNAWVLEDASVFGNVRVFGCALLFENTKVSGGALVSGNAQLFGNSCVTGNSEVYGDAEVFGDAEVYGEAEVVAKTTRTPLHLSGLKYAVTITDEHVKIGFDCHTFKEWYEFSDKKIFSMDKKNDLEFWKKNKDLILSLITHTERN